MKKTSSHNKRKREKKTKEAKTWIKLKNPHITLAQAFYKSSDLDRVDDAPIELTSKCTGTVYYKPQKEDVSIKTMPNSLDAWELFVVETEKDKFELGGWSNIGDDKAVSLTREIIFHGLGTELNKNGIEDVRASDDDPYIEPDLGVFCVGIRSDHIDTKKDVESPNIIRLTFLKDIPKPPEPTKLKPATKRKKHTKETIDINVSTQSIDPVPVPVPVTVPDAERVNGSLQEHNTNDDMMINPYGSNNLNGIDNMFGSPSTRRFSLDSINMDVHHQDHAMETDEYRDIELLRLHDSYLDKKLVLWTDFAIECAELRKVRLRIEEEKYIESIKYVVNAMGKDKAKRLIDQLK
jgi:hypothetical protein